MSNNQRIEHVLGSISVIIPAMNDWDNLNQVLRELSVQHLKPTEIIIADSSSDDEIEQALLKNTIDLPVRYLRVGKAFWGDRFLLEYFKIF